MTKIVRYRKVGIFFCVILFLFGAWLTFILPNKLANNALEEAQTIYISVEKNLSEIELRTKKLTWYKPIYSQKAQVIIIQCKEKLAEINSTINLAQKSDRAKEKRIYADTANKKLTGDRSVVADIAFVSATLDSYVASTAQARTKIAKLQDKLHDHQEVHKVAVATLDTKKSNYLSKYTNKMTDELTSSAATISIIHKIFRQAKMLLPPSNTIGGGDPKESLKLLNQCNLKMKISEDLIELVNNELIFQKDAIQKAVITVNSATNLLENSIQQLNRILQTTNLSTDKALRVAHDMQTNANQLLIQSKEALNIVIEDEKRDLASAYRLGLKVISLSSDIINEAEGQVQLLNAAGDKIRRVLNEIETAEKNIFDAVSFRLILSSNHTTATWQNVSNNIDEANTNLFRANENLSIAQARFNNQQFTDSLTFCDTAISKLNGIDDLLNELRVRARELEGYRSKWKRVRNQAQSTINSEQSEVSQYGTHSYSAQSDFDDAEDLLREANNLAFQRDYESAVIRAIEANELAEGTGTRAYRAYEDDQEDARRLSDYSNSSPLDNSSSSGSFDTGGGGFSSPSSSGDGGGFSSPSSGGDGGGWQ